MEILVFTRRIYTVYSLSNHHMYTFLTIHPADPQFDLFLSVPAKVYPYYKRQLAQKNQINSEYFVKGLVLLKDGFPVGRVGIYDNRHLIHQGQSVGSIGNYECIDELSVSQMLLNRAVEELAQLGVAYLIGPFNGSSWDDYCFITGHAHPNFFLEAFNPIYYNEQFKAFGFEIVGTRVSSIDRNLSGRHSSLEEKEQKFLQAGVRFRNIRLDRYEEELSALYHFIMKSFQEHPLFSPISWETFLAKYLPLKAWVDPDLVLIAEDQNQHMVGMFFCIQDFLNLEIQSLVAKTVARASGAEWQGLGDVMMSKMYRRARQKGFQAMIHAFMNDEFRSRLSAEYAGEVYKTYALYGLSVSEKVKPSATIVRNI